MNKCQHEMFREKKKERTLVEKESMKRNNRKRSETEQNRAKLNTRME